MTCLLDSLDCGCGRLAGSIAFYKLITIAAGLTLTAANRRFRRRRRRTVRSVPLTSLPRPIGPWHGRGDGTGRYPGATPPSMEPAGQRHRLRSQTPGPEANREPAKEAVPCGDYHAFEELAHRGATSGRAIRKQRNRCSDLPRAARRPSVPTKGTRRAPSCGNSSHASMENQTTHIHNGGICGRTSTWDFCLRLWNLPH